MRLTSPATSAAIVLTLVSCRLDEAGPTRLERASTSSVALGAETTERTGCADLQSGRLITGRFCAANDDTRMFITIQGSSKQIAAVLMFAVLGGWPGQVPEAIETPGPAGAVRRFVRLRDPASSTSLTFSLSELKGDQSLPVSIALVVLLREGTQGLTTLARGSVSRRIDLSPASVAIIGNSGAVLAGAASSTLAGVVVTIPPNALAEETIVAISSADGPVFDGVLAASSIGGTRVGLAVSVTTSEAQLARPAQITLPVALLGRTPIEALRGVIAVRLPQTGILEVLSNDDDAESPLQSYDEIGGTVTVATPGFSTFALVVPRAASTRVRGSANVGCATGTMLNAQVIDDQVVLRSPPRRSPIQAIVVHSTASGKHQSFDDLLAWTYDPNPNCNGSPCPAHYYIDKDGTTFRLVAEDFVAFHAIDNRVPPTYGFLNGVSVGIELFQRGQNGNPPIVWDSPPFEEAQYASLQLLLRGLLERYPGAELLYHSDVDSRRKIDPQEFDRSRIANLPSCSILSWALTLPAHSPPARFIHAMVYDEARGEVVVFGGYPMGALPNLIANDTWVWNGSDWTQRNPPISPPNTYYHAMAYDAARQQVVMFGGVEPGFGVRRFDTWVWDGTTWIQKHPANSPQVTYAMATAYDAARGEVLLFGGVDINGFARNDTWVWDGSNWTLKTPAHSPPVDQWPVMAYDAARAQVVLFGGGEVTSNQPTGTWVWDGVDWTQKNPSTSPPFLAGAAMAYDAARGLVVLFGGYLHGDGSGVSDTWGWNGTNWSQLAPVSSPSPRGYHAMAYDVARGRIVLFGGHSGPCCDASQSLNDTWRWPP
jgi:N-acetyl-anhydromuramyl-L-alanine amidase AmpD